jgi:sugar lactone lactonase YvrE
VTISNNDVSAVSSIVGKVGSTWSSTGKIYGVRAWASAGGGYAGGMVTSSNGLTTIIGIDNGGTVYVTSNAGVTVSEVTVNQNIRAAAMSYNGLNAVIGSCNYYMQTSNGGQTWTNLNMSTLFGANNNWINALAMSAGGDRIYVGTSGTSPFLYSSDSGATYTVMSTPFGAAFGNVNKLVCSYDGGVLAATGQAGCNIAVSTNYGDAWTLTTQPGCGNSGAAIAINDNGYGIFVAVPNSDIFVSTDLGNSWSVRAAASNVVGTGNNSNWNVLDMSANTAIVAVATYNVGYIYTSVDYGYNWSKSSLLTPSTSFGWGGLTVSKDGLRITAAINNGTVWTSPDSGSNWSTMSNFVYQTWGLAAIKCSYNGSNAIGNGGPSQPVQITSNGGQTWVSQTMFGSDAGYPNSAAISSNGSTMIVMDNGGYPNLSTNYGTTWTKVTSFGSVNGASPMAMSYDGTFMMVAAYNTTPYISSNSGSTWSALSAAGSQQWCSLAMSSNGSNILLLVNGNSNAFLSTNRGASWTTNTVIAAGLNGWFKAASMSMDGTRMFAALQNGGIYVSSNSGAAWVLSTAGTSNWTGVSCSANGEQVLATVYDGYPLISMDGGVSWATQTSQRSAQYGSATVSGDGSTMYAGYQSSGAYTPIVSYASLSLANSTVGGVTLSGGAVSNAATSSNSIGGIVLSNSMVGGVSIASNAIGNVPMSPATNYTITVAGAYGDSQYVDGVGTNARFGGIQYISQLDPINNVHYCIGWNSQVMRTYNPTTNVVTSIAGSGYNGTTTDGTGTNAFILSPAGGLALAAGGGAVYFPDGNSVRKCTYAGVVTSLAGTPYGSGFTDGTGTNAVFSNVSGLTLDPSGSNLYISDTNNHVIRILNLTTNAVTTWATTPSTLNYVTGTGGFDSNGNYYTLYRYGDGTNRIAKITPAGVITTVAGGASIYSVDGVGTNAGLCGVNQMYVDKINNIIYVVEGWVSGSMIRKVDMLTWTVTSPTGPMGYTPTNGVGTNAKWSLSYSCVADPTGLNYVLASDNYMLRKMMLISGYGGVVSYAGSVVASNASTLGGVSLSNGTVNGLTISNGLVGGVSFTSNVIGSVSSIQPNGSGTQGGITVNTGALAVANINSYANAVTGIATTFAGSTGYNVNTVDGTGTNAVFGYIYGMCYDAKNGWIYVLERDSGYIRRIVVSNAVVTKMGGGYSSSIVNGVGTNAKGTQLRRGVVDSNGNLYFTDNNAVRKMTSTGVFTTVAGSLTNTSVDGTGTSATFMSPGGIAMDSSQTTLFVVDKGAHKVRKIVISTGVVTSIAGNGSAAFVNGVGTNARFSSPDGIAYDPITGDLFVAETANSRIRRVTQSGVVSTFSGNGFQWYDSSGSYASMDGVGTNGRYQNPVDIVYDAVSSNFYIADYAVGAGFVQRLSRTGTKVTLCGNNFNQNNYPGGNGSGYAATFTQFNAITVDNTGTVYVGQMGWPRVCMISIVQGFGGLAMSSSSLLTGSASIGGITIGNGNLSSARSGTFGTISLSNNAITTSSNTSNAIGGIILSNTTLSNVSSMSGPRTLTDYNVTTLTPWGAGVQNFTHTIDRSTNLMYIQVANVIYAYNITTGVSNAVAGSGSAAFADGVGTNASVVVNSMTMDPNGGTVYFMDNFRLRKLNLLTATVSSIAGNGSNSNGYIDGTGTNARLNCYRTFGVDPTGVYAYWLDSSIDEATIGRRLRRCTLATGVVTTLAGNATTSIADGVGTNAALSNCQGVVCGLDSLVYVSDISTFGVRRYDPVSGIVSSIAALSGISGGLMLNVDALGNIWNGTWSDPKNNQLRVYNPTTQSIIATIGVAGGGYADGNQTTARFGNMLAISFTSNNVGYMTEWSASGVGSNTTFRVITPVYTYTPLALTALSTSGTISVQQIQETLNTIASPGSGTVVADWSLGDIWYVTSMTANFTINLTNMPITANKSYSVVFTLVQGATPYYISALQIAGVEKTIKWPGASAPTATASRVETETFTLMYTGSAWTVLGQLTSFG